MKWIGLVPGKAFDQAKAEPVVRAELERVPGDGLSAMWDKLPTLARVANGWSMNTHTVDLRRPVQPHLVGGRR